MYCTVVVQLFSSNATPCESCTKQKTSLAVIRLTLSNGSSVYISQDDITAHSGQARNLASTVSQARLFQNSAAAAAAAGLKTV